MCSFAPIWGWLAAFLAAVGGAVSSAFFGAAWLNGGPLVYLASIGFSATPMWATIALFLVIGLVNALVNFCNCTSNVPSCAPCFTLRGLIGLLTALLGVLVGLAALEAFLLDGLLGLGVMALAVAIAGLAIAILIMAGTVAACQPAPTPSGSGTGNLESGTGLGTAPRGA